MKIQGTKIKASKEVKSKLLLLVCAETTKRNFKTPEKTRLKSKIEYTVLNNMELAARTPKSVFWDKIAVKHKNSPMKPEVRGKAILANEKKKKQAPK